MNYSEIDRLIEKFRLTQMAYGRFDCPICKGRRTFGISISQEDDSIVYNCFKANCHVKGRINSDNKRHKLTQVASFLNKEEFKSNTIKIKNEVPLVLGHIGNHQEKIKFLEKYNLDYKILNNLRLQISYDPRKHRILFQNKYLYNNFAMGRTLFDRIKPKWLVYGEKPSLFVVDSRIRSLQSYKSIVLVEDVLSAIKVTHLTDSLGVALLGTSLSDNAILSLQQLIKERFWINSIYACLDSDAQVKNLELEAKIKVYFPNKKVDSIHLNKLNLHGGKDIKDLDDSTIKNLLSI